jgi:hypothetical protein
MTTVRPNERSGVDGGTALLFQGEGFRSAAPHRRLLASIRVP